jgi:hypothetical protein
VDRGIPAQTRAGARGTRLVAARARAPGAGKRGRVPSSSQAARRSVGPGGLLARLAAALVLAWSLGFLWYLWSLPGPADLARQTDGVVVLTGGSGRLARGVAVMEAGAAQRMLISGVDKTVRPNDLQEVAGVPPRLLACCIDLGFAAQNTRANAEEIAQWAARRQLGSVRVVTANHHLPRAMGEVRARLPAGVALLGDGVPDAKPLAHLAAEYSKLLASRATLLWRRGARAS